MVVSPVTVVVVVSVVVVEGGVAVGAHPAIRTTVTRAVSLWTDMPTP
jgi:hypothetical protein